MDHWRNQRGNQKILRDKWQQRHNNPKRIGHGKSSSKRNVYSNILLPQERRKSFNKQPNLTPKTIRYRRADEVQNFGKEIKYQSKNQWNVNKENNREDEWKQKFVLWKDQLKNL